MKLYFSLKARNDLRNIHQYLCDYFDEKIAHEKLVKVLKDVDLLVENPFMGVAITDNMRKLGSGPSIIIYEVVENIIEILHIVDSRTDYMKKLVG